MRGGETRKPRFGLGYSAVMTSVLVALVAATELGVLMTPDLNVALCSVGRCASDAGMGSPSIHKANNRRGIAQGRKRVIQRRFNVSVPRARVSETAPTLRERSER